MNATVTMIACPTCKGVGSYIGSDEPHPCFECHGAKAVEREWCDEHGEYVSVGSTAPFEAGSRYRICRTCRDQRVAHEASVEAEYRDVYGDDVKGLAVYQVEGR